MKTWMHRTLLGCCLALLVSLSLEAEVRVQDRGGLSLEQRSITGGIWASREPAASGVVNPNGDLLGDGAPAHAVRDAELLAAWVSPADGAIRWSRASSAMDVSSGAIIPAESAVGVPIVVPTDGAAASWAVAWQEYEQGETRIALAGINGQAGPAMDLGSGLLVGMMAVGDVVHVLSLDDQGLSLSTVIFVHLPDVPDDIPLALPDIPDDIPLAQLVSRSDLEHGLDGEIASPSLQGRAASCSDDGGSMFALRVGRGRVAEIELDEAGVQAVRVRRGALPKCAR